MLERRKWTKAVPNFEKGDLVLVVDPQSPRGLQNAKLVDNGVSVSEDEDEHGAGDVPPAHR